MYCKSFWWSRGGSNPRPLRCELDNRQNAKYLPFRKLQPPKKIKGFYILSHSLPSRTRPVLFFLVTYWSFGNWLNHTLQETKTDNSSSHSGRTSISGLQSLSSFDFCSSSTDYTISSNHDEAYQESLGHSSSVREIGCGLRYPLA